MEDVKPDEPILISQICTSDLPPGERILKRAIHDVKAFLNYSGVVVGDSFETEYSHHYGLARFREVGCVLITVINREYAKKILVLLPKQTHPAHFHKLKEETFLVLEGELDIWLDGKHKQMKKGDKLTVFPGVWHSFSSETGCILEEISTTAFKTDSVYKDDEINKKTVDERKTKVDHWGRFVLSKELLKKR